MGESSGRKQVKVARPEKNKGSGRGSSRRAKTPKPSTENTAARLAMVALDGLSQREVSTRLGLSEGYVSKLLQRSRAQLSALGWEVES